MVKELIIYPVKNKFKKFISIKSFYNNLAILNEAIPATLKEIQQQSDDAIDSSEKLIAVLDTMTTLSQNQLSKDVTKSKIQEAMINFRQLELYLNILSNDVRQSAREIEDLLLQFKARLDQLKTTIQNKTASVIIEIY